MHFHWRCIGTLYDGNDSHVFPIHCQNSNKMLILIFDSVWLEEGRKVMELSCQSNVDVGFGN